MRGTLCRDRQRAGKNRACQHKRLRDGGSRSVRLLDMAKPAIRSNMGCAEAIVAVRKRRPDEKGGKSEAE